MPATREKMDIAAIGLKARTGRAIAVCLTGWLLALAFAVVVGLLFGPTVS